MTERWEQMAHWPGGTVTAVTATGTIAATPAGLHLSSDAGLRWRWIALGPDPIVEAVVASPAFAMDRTLFAGTNSGLHRSVDGGHSWRQVVAGGPVPTIVLAPDFDQSGLAFAGTA